MIKSNLAQLKTIQNILKRFKAGDLAQILAWYTGGGKTHIFLSVISKLLEQNPKLRIGISAYFHTNIKNQIAERITNYGVSAATIDSRKSTSDASVLIFNPQALYGNEALDFKFDFLFIDESHAGFGEGRKMLRYIFENHCKPKCQTLAISATPWELFSLQQFKTAVTHKRGIDRGYAKDHRVADVTLKFHEADVVFHDKAFNAAGDLKETEIRLKRDVLRSASIKKIDEIRSHCDKDDKVLIVAPAGWDCGIAEEIATHLGPEALLLTNKTENEDQIIEHFKTSPSIRFLVVINKCRIGYDMPELTRTINLSMTKNIKKLVHDLGRISRLNPQNPRKVKTYHYVFNQAMGQDEVEALFRLVLKCAAGQYPSKAKITPITEEVEINGDFGSDESEITLQDLLKFIKLISFKKPESIRVFGKRRARESAVKVLEAKNKARDYQCKGFSRKDFSNANKAQYRLLLKVDRIFLNDLWPHYAQRTLETALRDIKKYSTRNELVKNDNALYTWFRLNGHIGELDTILPRLSGWGKWSLASAKKEGRKYKTRNLFRSGSPGAFSHVNDNEPSWLVKHFGKSKRPRYDWSFDSIVQEAQAKGFYNLRKLRDHLGGAESWLRKNGLTEKFKQVVTSQHQTEQLHLEMEKARKTLQDYTDQLLFRKEHPVVYSLLRKYDCSLLIKHFPNFSTKLKKDSSVEERLALSLSQMKRAKSRHAFMKKHRNNFMFMKKNHPETLNAHLPRLRAGKPRKWKTSTVRP